MQASASSACGSGLGGMADPDSRVVAHAPYGPDREALGAGGAGPAGQKLRTRFWSRWRVRLRPDHSPPGGRSLHGCPVRTPTVEPGAYDPRMAFTLTELLAVLTLVVLLLSMAAPAVIDWGRMGRMRSATSSVASSLSVARAQAVALAQPVSWIATNLERRAVWAYSLHVGPEGELLGTTNLLSKGIWLAAYADQQVDFLANGTVAGGDREVVLWEHDRGEKGLMSTVLVYRVTGETRVLGP